MFSDFFELVSIFSGPTPRGPKSTFFDFSDPEICIVPGWSLERRPKYDPMRARNSCASSVTQNGPCNLSLDFHADERLPDKFSTRSVAIYLGSSTAEHAIFGPKTDFWDPCPADRGWSEFRKNTL